MSHQLAKRWFTVSEYNRMAEAGILTKDDRVELIEGEIVTMSPIGSRHAGCVNRLNVLLSSQAAQSFIVSVQNPIIADDYSEPQPDVAVLRLREDFYGEEHPKSEDVLLVIEVADTTVESDRSVKMPLYARASIPEAVLVNLPHDLFEVHSEPVNGQYQSVKILRRGEVFVSNAIPHLELETDAVLG
ncbi:MAG: Uma2 family endonuclease [Acidobacteriota bacterium]|nr:Uma2 family endonuclease [Acidobacteriota bacterium]